MINMMAVAILTIIHKAFSFRWTGIKGLYKTAIPPKSQAKFCWLVLTNLSVKKIEHPQTTSRDIER